MLDHVLYIGLLRVGHSAPRGPLALPFQLIGVDLARIENFQDAPSNWEVRISTLSENQLAFPASAFVTHDDHLYAFAFFDRGDGRSPRMLSRIPLEALEHWKPDLTKDLETLSSRSDWIQGFRPNSAQVLMADDASEMSVHFDSTSQHWLAIYNPPLRTTPPPAGDRIGEPVGAAQIQMRRAAQLEGPWTAPQTIAEIPEMRDSRVNGHDENLFCYAAKAHPQFSKKQMLTVTYVCSLFARSDAESLDIMRKLQNTPSLYRPLSLSIALP